MKRLVIKTIKNRSSSGHFKSVFRVIPKDWIFCTNLMTVGQSSGYSRPRLATAWAWSRGQSRPACWGGGPGCPPPPRQWRHAAARMRSPPSPLCRLPQHLGAGCFFWETFSLAAFLFPCSVADSLHLGTKFSPSFCLRNPVVKCCRCKNWWSCGSAGCWGVGGEGAWLGWTPCRVPLRALALFARFLPSFCLFWRLCLWIFKRFDFYKAANHFFFFSLIVCNFC